MLACIRSYKNTIDLIKLYYLVINTDTYIYCTSYTNRLQVIPIDYGHSRCNEIYTYILTAGWSHNSDLFHFVIESGTVFHRNKKSSIIYRY